MAGKTKTQTEKPDPGRFFWRLLLAASLIAATVSLLTTGLGLGRYVSFPLAWSLAFAVQLGLFGLAWLIGVGRSEHRGWLSALYLVTMWFSVTFSYVTLQSEFTEHIRPAEAQRRLFDTARESLAQTSHVVGEGLSRSADLELRLASWLDMEKANGWATRTCEEAEHCYLRGVCDRVRRRISRWEAESGRAYREGPGQALIFGTLNAELGALRQVGRRLGEYRDRLQNGNGVLDPGIDNQERLKRLDAVLNRAPVDDLAAMTCGAAVLPEPPSYEDHARDLASADEQPVYAWTDLVALLDARHELQREDYPTIFAGLLALFIDVFVLVVALGASVIARHEPESVYAAVEGVPGTFEEVLRRDIDGWIDGSLLGEAQEPGRRFAFLRSLVEAISFDSRGDARLIPADEDQRRFGHLLVQAKAATISTFVKYNRAGRLFLLEDWVYPALTRHLAGGGAPQEA